MCYVLLKCMACNWVFNLFFIVLFLRRVLLWTITLSIFIQFFFLFAFHPPVFAVMPAADLGSSFAPAVCVYLEPWQLYCFHQFVVRYGHNLVSTHTHEATRTNTHTVNPTAGLVCHTGGGCVIGWICSPARYRDSPLKFHFTSGSVNKPWDY